MKKNKKYWNEIAGYLSGEMNKQQESAFLNKVKMNMPLNNDYILMKKNWTNYNVNPDKKYSDTNRAWETLNRRLSTEGMLETNPKIGISALQYTFRIAAIIFLILAVGLPTLYLSINELSKGESIIQHHSNGGTLTVDLPDGSRVFLNDGSELEYLQTFEENRDVTLKGEGYFEVMSDPKRPFHVSSGKVVVTVLGTSFNIKETEKNDIQVFVESGKVRLDMEQGNESLILHPGELGKANGHLSKSKLQNENYLAWKTKDFKFVDESVINILEVLEQAYHVEVSSDQVLLNDMRLTTTYSGQSFDAILNTICTALNINYEKDGKVYKLQAN